MSSPVHHPKDLDPALMYAPPWARAPRSGRGFGRRRGVPAAGNAAARWGDGDEDVEPKFHGDRAMLELRRKLSLDPQTVPAPPRLDEGVPVERIALRMCAVACVGAVFAWVLTSNVVSVVPTPSMAKSPGNEPAVAAAAPAPAPRIVKLISVRVPAEEQPTPAAALANVEAPAPPTRPVPAATQEVDAAVVAPPSAAEPARAGAAPALGHDEIARLVERGKSYLLDGDIAAARLLLQRAAEAGSAEAALALGSTFDPRVIARLGAIGVTTDPHQARQWYEKAAQLGSPIASQQLASLADSDR